MIADDMMSFIKSDIIVFGLGVLAFIIATLWFVFRNLIWVVVPISSCFFSVIIMMGFLAYIGVYVRAISGLHHDSLIRSYLFHQAHEK